MRRNDVIAAFLEEGNLEVQFIEAGDHPRDSFSVLTADELSRLIDGTTITSLTLSDTHEAEEKLVDVACFRRVCEVIQNLEAIEVLVIGALSCWDKTSLLYLFFYLSAEPSKIALYSLEPQNIACLDFIHLFFPGARELALVGNRAGIASQTIEPMARLIGNMDLLDTLQLVLVDCGGENEMETLCRAIENSKNIKHLKLACFEEAGGGLNLSSCERLAKLVQRRESLRSLHFEETSFESLEPVREAILGHKSLTRVVFDRLTLTNGAPLTFDRHAENEIVHRLNKNSAQEALGSDPSLRRWVETVVAARNQIEILGVLFSDMLCPTIFAKAALEPNDDLDDPATQRQLQTNDFPWPVEEDSEALFARRVFTSS